MRALITSPRRDAALTVPVPSTMPVNMSCLPRRAEHGACRCSPRRGPLRTGEPPGTTAQSKPGNAELELRGPGPGERRLRRHGKHAQGVGDLERVVAAEGRPAPRPPSSSGARNRATCSTSRAVRNEPSTSEPPSTIRLVSPRARRAPRAGPSARQTRLALDRQHLDAFGLERPPARGRLAARRRARARGGAADQPRGGRSAQPGVEHHSRERPAGAGRRQRRHGTSASTVPTPTSTASCSRRSQRAWRLCAGLVIHFERPAAVAMRPSSVVAALSRTNGRNARRAAPRKRSLSRTASPASRPVSTATPARRRSRASPAADDGVRVRHGHHHPRDARVSHERRAGRGAAEVGARLERHVQGRAARANAGLLEGDVSACGPPGPLVPPLADDARVLATTPPTAGFGFVSPSPRAASASAWRISCRSPGAARGTFGAHERTGERLGVEREQVVRLLPDADEADRHVELAHDRDRDAALGRAVELGQDDAGHADGLRELAPARRRSGRWWHRGPAASRAGRPVRLATTSRQSCSARASGWPSCAAARRCPRAARPCRARAPRAGASVSTAEGSAPSAPRWNPAPARCAQTSSCSAAAARNVSAAHSSTRAALVRARAEASLPIVVGIVPAPVAPAMDTDPRPGRRAAMAALAQALNARRSSSRSTSRMAASPPGAIWPDCSRSAPP